MKKREVLSLIGYSFILAGLINILIAVVRGFYYEYED